MNTKSSFNGALRINWRQPCIYIWWRNRHCLYVGCSIKGIPRVLSSAHHVIGLRDEVQEHDQFDFYFIPNGPEDRLHFWETQLIRYLLPIYNGKFTGKQILDYVKIPDEYAHPELERLIAPAPKRERFSLWAPKQLSERGYV